MIKRKQDVSERSLVSLVLRFYRHDLVTMFAVFFPPSGQEVKSRSKAGVQHRVSYNKRSCDCEGGTNVADPVFVCRSGKSSLEGAKLCEAEYFLPHQYAYVMHPWLCGILTLTALCKKRLQVRR